MRCMRGRETSTSMSLGIEMPAVAHSGARTPGAVPADTLVLASRGWSAAGVDCGPKIAALAALAELAPAAPVASVSYRSQGNLLIVAAEEAPRARECARRLADRLHVTLLESSGDRAEGPFASWFGRVETLTGFLGEFDVRIEGLRTGAPATEAAGSARFDLVLDFSAQPLFSMRQPPQGYFHAPEGEGALDAVLAELAEAVGEFEKPKFFAYRENLCTHSRSHVSGCNACIEICSTQAIAPDGDHVKVDAHLCMGCGACATVCPSGAMGYQYPRVPERAARMKALLAAYRAAGGRDACLVFHNGADGLALLEAAARAGEGLPARALPLESWHVASVGLDLLLPAVAYGATQVVLLAAGSEDAEYRAALREQMALGETILHGLGYGGTHYALVEAGDAHGLRAAFDALGSASGVRDPASFLLTGDKRTSIEFALEHLLQHAPTPLTELPLPAGAPFGEVRVDAAKCTMCLACAGACPVSALMDGVDRPLLKFIERNCVQCGLCEATCPENAISLSPRLLLGPAAREARVLNEAQPFHCVRCDKPFGTRQMVEAMTGRLAGHSMFSGSGALRRLQMCADCRVVDLMNSKEEVSVLRLGADS